MSLSNLFKKASEIFSGSSSQDLRQGPVYQDGETIFCKLKFYGFQKKKKKNHLNGLGFIWPTSVSR